MWPELDLLILLRIFFNPFGLVAIGSTIRSRPALLASLSRTSPPRRSPRRSRTLPDRRNRPTTPLVSWVSGDYLKINLWPQLHFHTTAFHTILMLSARASPISSGFLNAFKRDGECLRSLTFPPCRSALSRSCLRRSERPKHSWRRCRALSSAEMNESLQVLAGASLPLQTGIRQV